MKRPLVTLAITLLSLIAVGCAGISMKGKVEGGRYYSPLSNFNIALPNFAGLQIQDQNDSEGGRVSFPDQFGNLWAVTYLRLPADSATILSEPEKRDNAYRGFVTDYAMQSLFRKVSPQSSVVKEEFIDAQGSRAYFAVVNIPGASAIFDPKKNQRLDSVRGLLVFDKNGFMYMLEDEMNTVFHQTSASSLTAKQLDDAQATLKRIKESMAFK